MIKTKLVIKFFNKDEEDEAIFDFSFNMRIEKDLFFHIYARINKQAITHYCSARE